MRDETMLILSLVAAGTIISLAMIMRDRGTYIIRDAQGNITAILPNRGAIIDQRTSSTSPAAVGNEFGDPLGSYKYREANR